MPTSVPGSKPAAPVRQRGGRWRGRAAGFTLIGLLIVIAIIAVSSGLIVLSLRDGHEARLEEEGERLSALLEMARADSRFRCHVVDCGHDIMVDAPDELTRILHESA